jgi:hypothetical protein
MLKIYILLLGFFMMLMGVSGIIFPMRMFSLWQKWIAHRYFFLHGIILIILGLPLTLYHDSFIGRMTFLCGIVAVLTGPFIIIYSNNLKRVFLETSDDLNTAVVRKMIYVDAIIRITVAALFIYNGIQPLLGAL